MCSSVKILRFIGFPRQKVVLINLVILFLSYRMVDRPEYVPQEERHKSAELDL